MVYAKYCKKCSRWRNNTYAVSDNVELPHEGDMYTGDFAEEMKIARETAAKENEAEETAVKEGERKRKSEKKSSKISRIEEWMRNTLQVLSGVFMIKKESENYRDSNGQVKVQNTYKWKGSDGAYRNGAVCRDGKVTDLIRYVQKSSSSYSSSSNKYSSRSKSSSNNKLSQKKR